MTDLSNNVSNTFYYWFICIRNTMVSERNSTGLSVGIVPKPLPSVKLLNTGLRMCIKMHYAMLNNNSYNNSKYFCEWCFSVECCTLGMMHLLTVWSYPASKRVLRGSLRCLRSSASPSSKSAPPWSPGMTNRQV